MASTVLCARKRCRVPSSRHSASTPTHAPLSIRRSRAKYSTKNCSRMRTDSQVQAAARQPRVMHRSQPFEMPCREEGSEGCWWRHLCLVLQRSPVERVEHGMASPVGCACAAVGLPSPPEVQALPPERPLINLAVVCAGASMKSCQLSFHTAGLPLNGPQRRLSSPI